MGVRPMTSTYPIASHAGGTPAVPAGRNHRIANMKIYYDQDADPRYLAGKKVQSSGMARRASPHSKQSGQRV